MRRVGFVVTGRVQGVGFRALARAEAQRLGLSGFVRNRHDGAVEGEAQGAASVVAAFVQWLEQGPPWARVDGLELRDLPAAHDQGPFDVRR